MLSFCLALVLAQGAIPSEVKTVLDRLVQFHPRILPDAPAASFTVAGRSSIRLVIREPIPGGGQQEVGRQASAPTTPEYNHSQIILVSGDEKLAQADESSLPWADLRQDEKPATRYLGVGQGFVWYAKMPPHEEVWLIQLAGLAYSADPIEISFESLGMASDANAWHAKKFLAAFGDRTLARLIEWVESGKDKWPRALQTIGMIDSSGATRFLVRFYESRDKDKREEVWRALETSTPRKGAKDIYMDMARAGFLPRTAALAAVEFEWGEFAPVLEDTLKTTYSLTEYRDLFIMARTLRRLSVPERVMKAIQRMSTPGSVTPKQLQEARSALVNYGDPEPIAVAAFAAWYPAMKGPSEANAFAHQVLLSLPKFGVAPFLEKVIRESPDKEAVAHARALLQEIKG